MLAIRLFCAAGMSTSLLERRIKDAARGRGLDIEVEAHPANELDRGLVGADVALLGPQVRFMLDSVSRKCAEKGIPVAVIPMREYGTVNGEKVLDLALELVGEGDR